MTIEDIKHCLLTMIDCELCEECNLYGTTGTDHCEHDCVNGALDIINKYERIEQILKEPCIIPEGCYPMLKKIKRVVEDGNDN